MNKKSSIMSEPKNNLSTARDSKEPTTAKISDKDLIDSNFGEDSGFLSGYSQDKYSSQLDSVIDDVSTQQTKRQTAPSTKQQTEETFDSGLIDDSDMVQSATVGKLPALFEKLDLDRDTKYLFDSNKIQKRPEIYDQLEKKCYQQDEEGDTQLHISIITEPQEVTVPIIHLASKSSLLDIQNDYGQAPIHLAVVTGQPLIVRRLLIAGAKATIRDGDGNTPLHLACKNNDLLSVRAILTRISPAEMRDYGILNQSNQSQQQHRRIPVDLEQRNYFGENCIHIATQNNNTEILKHLLDAGADINAREGRGGYTPLHIAVENQNEDLVKFLLKNATDKINVETLTYGRLTAYQLANVYASKNIMSLLEQYGCEPLMYPESDYDDDSDMESDIDSDA